jgi:hypothetical protein
VAVAATAEEGSGSGIVREADVTAVAATVGTSGGLKGGGREGGDGEGKGGDSPRDASPNADVGAQSY